MKKSVLTGAASILLAAAVLLGAPAALAASGEPEAAAAPGTSFDESLPNSLTVDMEESYKADLKPAPIPALPGGEEPGETEPAAPLAVDLYLIAQAKASSGGAGYTYSFTGGTFAGLEELFGQLTETDGETETVPAAVWQEMALTAARTLFGLTGEGGAVKPVSDPAVSLNGLKTATGLKAGLYLIVPHGAGLESADYVEIEGDDLATLAYSEEYTYRFTPYLVSLPGRNVEGPDTTGGSTADGTGWSYEVTSFLKVTREPRFGQLRIVKGIDAYRDGWDASFVFQIEAVKGEGEDRKVVYRNVVSLDFKAGEMEKSVTLDRIPAGSTVTVTEVYSGASYTADAGTIDGLTVSAAELTEARFHNTHNDRNSGGYGANNHYEYSEEGGTWNYVPPAGA